MLVSMTAQCGRTPKDKDELVLFPILPVGDITTYSTEGQITECLTMLHISWLLSLIVI